MFGCGCVSWGGESARPTRDPPPRAEALRPPPVLRRVRGGKRPRRAQDTPRTRPGRQLKARPGVCWPRGRRRQPAPARRRRARRTASRAFGPRDRPEPIEARESQCPLSLSLSLPPSLSPLPLSCQRGGADRSHARRVKVPGRTRERARTGARSAAEWRSRSRRSGRRAARKNGALSESRPSESYRRRPC